MFATLAACRPTPRALVAAVMLTLTAVLALTVAGAVQGAAVVPPVYCFVPAPC